MKRVIVFSLFLILPRFSLALSSECKTKIKTAINVKYNIKEEDFRVITFSPYLLANGQHSYWSDYGLKLISVQYYFDSEFVEIMAKLKDECKILELFKIMQINQ